MPTGRGIRGRCALRRGSGRYVHPLGERGGCDCVPGSPLVIQGTSVLSRALSGGSAQSTRRPTRLWGRVARGGAWRGRRSRTCRAPRRDAARRESVFLAPPARPGERLIGTVYGLGVCLRCSEDLVHTCTVVARAL